jgi:hypothetical protein
MYQSFSMSALLLFCSKQFFVVYSCPVGCLEASVTYLVDASITLMVSWAKQKMSSDTA